MVEIFSELILNYCKNKGVDSKDSLMAVKKSLKIENGGKHLEIVENTSSITIEKVILSKILYNKVHFSRLKPIKPNFLIGSDELLGVIVDKDSYLFLVDGHHRLKYALMMERVSGVFIILK